MCVESTGLVWRERETHNVVLLEELVHPLSHSSVKQSGRGREEINTRGDYQTHTGHTDEGETDPGLGNTGISLLTSSPT